MSADAQAQPEQQPQQQAQEQAQQQQSEQQSEQQAPAESSAQEQPKEKKPNPLKNIIKTLFNCFRKPKVTDETDKEQAGGAEKEAKKVVSGEDGQANGHDDANANANAAAVGAAGGEEKTQAVPDHLGGAAGANDGKGVTTIISAN